jgi:hypothetical protein
MREFVVWAALLILTVAVWAVWELGGEVFANPRRHPRVSAATCRLAGAVTIFLAFLIARFL